MPNDSFSHRPRLRHGRRHQHWRNGLMAIMETPATSPEANEINVGGCLRELRTRQGLSIRALADMAGLNFNTLSLIENGKTSPSVSTLQRIAQALEIPITAFFENVPLREDAIYQKPGQRPLARFEQGQFEDLGNGLTLGEGLPLLMTLESGADSGDSAIVHTGQEFVYCLEGHLTYAVAEKEYDLSPGDSLIFQAHLPHRWGNRGQVPCRSILILCPADEDDQSAEQHFPTELVEA
jgi:transcriptional regulator with XRE-family HTH domain